MKTISYPIIVSLLISLPQLSFGWGQTGHRIAGEIASGRLLPQTAQKVKDILGGESLARAATWPDEVRSDPAHYAYATPWHFMEIPEGHTVATMTHPPEGDTYTALLKLEKILQDGSATLQQKKEALRFVVHFVGDLHQPLHVGNGLDHGGNWCSVTWMNKPTNLHAVWDDELIDALKLSYTEYSKFLLDSLEPTNEKTWTSGRYADWMEESAKYRDGVYPKVTVNGVDQGHAYCKDPTTGPVDPKLVPKLSYDYGFQSRPVLDQRLVQGGIRLAYTLNEIFAGRSLSSEPSAP